MAIEMTKDEKKKNFQRWAMKKFLHRQYEIPGLCHRCPFIKEQKEHSLPPGLHPPLVNGKLPKWATKIKPNHENLDLLECLCKKMKDRTNTLVKLRTIAKELESLSDINGVLEGLKAKAKELKRLREVDAELDKLRGFAKELESLSGNDETLKRLRDIANELERLSDIEAELDKLKSFAKELESLSDNVEKLKRLRDIAKELKRLRDVDAELDKLRGFAKELESLSDNVEKLKRLRDIANELESLWESRTVSKLDISRLWLYHFSIINLYRNVKSLTIDNKEVQQCKRISSIYESYISLLSDNTGSLAWYTSINFSNNSSDNKPRSLPINLVPKSFEICLKNILSLASLLYTRVQLLSLNSKTDFLTEKDVYYLKKLQNNEDLLSTLFYPDVSHAVLVEIASFGDQKKFLNEGYCFILDIAGIGTDEADLYKKLKRRISQWEFPLRFGDEEVVFLVNSQIDVMEFKYHGKSVKKFYCTTGDYFLQFLSESRKDLETKKQLEEFNESDYFLLLRIEDRSKEKNITNQLNSRHMNYVLYYPEENQDLFKQIKKKIKEQEKKRKESNEAKGDDLSRIENRFPITLRNIFSFYGKSLSKIILELATAFYYPPLIEDLPDNEDTWNKLKEKYKGKSGIPVSETPDYINNVNKERRERYSIKINYILHFDQKLISQGVLYKPHKSLLDLLIAQFENMRGSRHTPEHSVDDRNTGNIPEHFLHPTTTKKAGGKRIPTSWFVRKDSEKHGAWNAAVIAVLVRAIHDWVVEGKETSAPELHVSIRNTNDRLCRLQNILYPPDQGTSGRKSLRDLSVEERRKIPIRDFAKALLAAPRKK